MKNWITSWNVSLLEFKLARLSIWHCCCSISQFLHNSNPLWRELGLLKLGQLLLELGDVRPGQPPKGPTKKKYGVAPYEGKCKQEFWIHFGYLILLDWAGETWNFIARWREVHWIDWLRLMGQSWWSIMIRQLSLQCTSGQLSQQRTGNGHRELWRRSPPAPHPTGHGRRSNQDPTCDNDLSLILMQNNTRKKQGIWNHHMAMLFKWYQDIWDPYNRWK